MYAKQQYCIDMIWYSEIYWLWSRVAWLLGRPALKRPRDGVFQPGISIECMRVRFIDLLSSYLYGKRYIWERMSAANCRSQNEWFVIIMNNIFQYIVKYRIHVSVMKNTLIWHMAYFLHRSIKRKKFDDEVVESSLTPSQPKIEKLIKAKAHVPQGQ